MKIFQNLNRLYLAFFLLFVWIYITVAEDDQGVINSNDDYFYSPNITVDQIKKAEEDRILKELENKKNEERSKSTEKPPDFFKANEKNEKNNEIDWDKYYMEKIMSEYMKKYQQEQLEKRRLKAKSELNHPVLSVLTLVTFFGLGSFIGLIIMCVRSKQFSNSKNKSDTKKNGHVLKPMIEQIDQATNVV
jgi:hypothetical protein